MNECMCIYIYIYIYIRREIFRPVRKAKMLETRDHTGSHSGGKCTSSVHFSLPGSTGGNPRERHIFRTEPLMPRQTGCVVAARRGAVGVMQQCILLLLPIISIMNSMIISSTITRSYYCYY